MSGNVGQVALGITGAVIGFYTGIGPAAGYSIGAAIGSVAFPPKLPGVEGPRLGDTRVQASVYGKDIPILFGKGRLAGTIIWAADLKEVSNTQDIGGKGQPTQQSTTYGYFADFAVMLTDCKGGEIIGISRIWDSYTGNLLYDIGDGNTITALTASSTLADSIIVYPGSSTQMPDPTIESYLGVGNVPAYRFRSYVVFTNMALEKFSNRIPNLEFEVIRSGSNVIYRQVEKITNAYPQSNTDINRISIDNGVITINTNHHLSFFDAQYKFDYELNYLSSNAVPEAELRDKYLGTIAGKQVYVDDYTGLIPGYSVLYAGSYIVARRQLAGAPYMDGNLFGACVDASQTKLYVLTMSSNNTVMTLSVYNEQLALLGSAIVTAQITPNNSQKLLPDGGGSVFAVESDNIHLWINDNYSTSPGTRVYRINSDYSLTILGSLSALIGGGANRWAGADDGLFIVAGMGTSGGPVTNQFVNIITRNPQMTSTTTALSDIVTELCTYKNADSESTLSPSDIDVTDLTDQVTGYIFSRQSPIRSAVEQLGQAFSFDSVESDGIIRFVKRGQAIVKDIPITDLAAHEDGSETPSPINITRQQEVEVPSSIVLNYTDPFNSYQVATQQSRRLNIASGSPVTLELPISMSPAKAKEVVDIMRFDASVARDTYTFSTTRKYSYLEPTDVVTIDTKVLRILSKDETPSGIINFTASAEDSRAYTKVFPAAPITIDPPGLFIPGPTLLVVMSLPPLRDTDATPCVYMAARGYLAGWNGCVVYKSLDNIAYTDVATLTDAAIIGAATTQLSTSVTRPDTNTFDESQSLTVRLTVDGTLNSASYLDVLNGRNAFALSAGTNGSSPDLYGWEIIQYRTAALNGDGTYTLSGLLRGRKGTEQWQYKHAIGDVFVLLDQGVYPVGIDSSDINQSRYWKPVSFGNKVTNAAPILYVDNGESVRPLSPVHIGGGERFNMDILIQWKRRSRVGQEWVGLVDVPVGEISELYELRTWADFNKTTFGRQITGVTANQYLYTFADQTADFGSPPAIIWVEIFQVSEVGGLGYVSFTGIPTT